MGIKRKRPRYPPTQGPFQNEIHRIKLRQFETSDRPLHQSLEMFPKAFARNLFNDHWIEGRLVSNEPNVIGISFVTGPGMCDLSQIKYHAVTSVMMT